MAAPLPTLRLDPAHPLLWRDDRTVQFGLDAVATLTVDAPWMERLLTALRTGIRPAAFDLEAFRTGAPRDAARRLLNQVRPALQQPRRQLPPVSLRLADDVHTRAATRIAEVFDDQAVPLSDERNAVIVPLMTGVATALACAPFLRDDRAHLPISFDPAGATVGPYVRPGISPCLTCRDTQQHAQDPAWPLVHAQMLGRDAVAVPVHLAVEAARIAVDLLEDDSAGKIVRVRIDGVRSERQVAFHAECQCRSLPENATVDVPGFLTSEPTRSTEFALPG